MLAGHLTCNRGHWRFATDGDSSAVARHAISADLLGLPAPSSRPIPWVKIERLAPEVKGRRTEHSRARAQNIATGVLGGYTSSCRRLGIPTVGNDWRVMIETRRAGPDDLRPASEVLGEAFADYPWTRWTVDPDDHQARITRLQLLALENLGMAFGAVWLSSLDSTVQSVAVWMDSAVPVPSSVHLAMDAAVAQLEGSRHDASLTAAREIEGWRPIQRHFTLAVLGTAPARQREGLGGRTLVPGLAAADREGAGSFLENVVGVEPRLLFDLRLRGHRPQASSGRRT